MNFNGFDDALGDDGASARGILQCLRMLAEEAAALGLPLTHTALRGALTTCLAESAAVTRHRGPPPDMPPPGAVIH